MEGISFLSLVLVPDNFDAGTFDKKAPAWLALPRDAQASCEQKRIRECARYFEIVIWSGGTLDFIV